MTAYDDHARTFLGKPRCGFQPDPGGAAQNDDAAIGKRFGFHTFHSYNGVALTPVRPASFLSRNSLDRRSNSGLPPQSAYPNRHSTFSCSSSVRPITSKIVSL